jgi:hypothetical protein
MSKYHTIVCSPGFILINDALNRHTDRGGIIRYAGISPFNTQEIEMPQRTMTFGTTSGSFPPDQIKLTD